VKFSRRAVAVLGIAAALLLFAAGWVVWRVERSIGGAEQKIAGEEMMGVEVHALALQPNPGFTELASPTVFRSAAGFQGKLYVGGPAGLRAYQGDGSLEHLYRCGLELPSSPLVQLAVGTLADSHVPELLIATAGAGVLAFDGERFRQILPHSADQRVVTAMLPLSSGRLLIGTAKSGLLVYDGSTLRRFHSTTDRLYITALAGTEAELWVGTLNQGVVHWQGGQAQQIGEAEGLPDPRVESIAAGANAVYVGTPDGVAEVAGGRVRRVQARGVFARTILAEPDALYIGQMQGGVLRVGAGSADGKTPRRAITVLGESSAAEESREQNNAPVEQLLRVGDARYAVTENALLLQEANGEWRNLLGSASTAAGQELADGNISAVLQASDGRLWVGYFDRGIDILPAAGGRAIHIEDEKVFCVNRIVENRREGTIAVATANGLVLFDRDGRERQALTRSSGLIAIHVTDVAVYGDGMVAGTPAGITFLDASGPHSMYAFEGLANNHVYALGVSGQGLMVGTLGGISLVKDGEVRRNLTTANSGMKANWTTALTSAGAEWLAGTYGGGVVRVSADGQVSATEATAQGTIVNPGAMASDGRVVLAGTLGRGLLVSDGTGTRWKTVTAGLPSLNVTALTIANGVVYVGTDNGLVKIAEDRL
jgi:ligand-binding sensor domain-containing protein